VLAAQETTRRMHTFLGIAGHEFRTPVTSIKASVQIAERALRAHLDDAAPTAATRPLQRAQSLLIRADQQVNRLNRLIEDILDVTRIQEGRLELRIEQGDLVAVVRQAVEAQLLAWPGRGITLDLQDTSVNLSMDADRIEQVVANFLTNALKYSAEDQPVNVRLAVEGRMARVAVRDHGPGLPPAAHTLIWEPFFRVDGHRQLAGSTTGLGLGLHICRTLIERHAGRVGVHSVEGEGCTFWFELPVAPTRRVTPRRAGGGAKGAAPRARKSAAPNAHRLDDGRGQRPGDG
jgi:signal transduction histidine kinase